MVCLSAYSVTLDAIASHRQKASLGHSSIRYNLTGGRCQMFISGSRARDYRLNVLGINLPVHRSMFIALVSTTFLVSPPRTLTVTASAISSPSWILSPLPAVSLQPQRPKAPGRLAPLRCTKTRIPVLGSSFIVVSLASSSIEVRLRETCGNRLRTLTVRHDMQKSAKTCPSPTPSTAHELNCSKPAATQPVAECR